MNQVEPWIRRVVAMVDGQALELCFDLGSLALAEQHLSALGTDICLMDGLPQDVDPVNGRCLFAASLQHFQPGIDFEVALKMVRLDNVSMILAKVVEAWRASFPDLVPQAGPPAKPSLNKAPAKTRVQRWREIESTARVNLHMGWSELSRITPAHWLTLMEALERKIERESAVPEFMLAQLTAVVANTGFRGWKQPRQSREFMPSEWRRTDEAAHLPKRRKRMSPKQAAAEQARIRSEAEAIFGALRKRQG